MFLNYVKFIFAKIKLFFMKKNYFIVLTLLILNFANAQKTIEFRITTVTSDIDDMDGFGSGDSDPSWRGSINDGSTSSNFVYDLSGVNCPGTRTVNDTFFSKVYNCSLPTNYTFTWSAFENDGTGSEASTGTRTVTIPSSALTQSVFTNYGTYTATVSGTRCGGGGTVTWGLTLQYRITGSFVSASNSQTNVTCFGGNDGTATVSPNGGASPYTYSWSPSGGSSATATGLLAGNYTCTITDLNGCQITRNINITEPSAINSNVTETTGTLTATQTGATYQWYQCPNTLLSGETNQNFTPTNIGDYKAVITIGACSVTSNCITVNTLNRNQFDLNSNLKLYPNPTEGQVNIEFTNLTNPALNITDVNGRVLDNQNLNNKKSIINISNLPKGIYIFKVYSNEGVSTQKIVKK